MDSTFNIIALHILPDCFESIRKVLDKNEWYFFNQKYKENNNELVLNSDYSVPNDLFSKNINIQAIVGKNGSGKSTVIEVMLRLINNVGNLLLQKANTDTKLSYVSGVFAELYYEKNGGIFSLKCEDDKIYYRQSSQDLIFNQYQQLFQSYENPPLSLEEAKPHLKQLFFTIVNNYSFHAYNEFDFIDEVESKIKDDIWIRGVFHKNDGYLTPLVLNPYRDFGVIDVEREKNLTNNRLALLFYAFNKEGIDFVPDYKLKFLTFRLNNSHVQDRYSKVKVEDLDLAKEPYKIEVSKDKEDVFNTTLRCYYPNYNIDERLEVAYKYLVYKTFSVSNKYPNYKDLINKHFVEFSQECTDEDKAKIKELVDKIKNDTSHTSLKVKQTLKYIDFVSDVSQETRDIPVLDEEYVDWKFDYYSQDDRLTRLDNIQANFPPPFYKPYFELKSIKEGFVKFEKMSSGERQFLFYISTILYHLKNLDSVVDDKESVQYEYANIILEEVELYFHPEYQKQFISKLIAYLEQASFENIKFYNVIIVTHSPFILSDIPEDNIMFLKKGKQENDKIDLITFGANIHELLRHGFFMNGTMGDYAKKKIEDVISFLEKIKNNQPIENRDLKIKEHKAIIDLIGEPVIKNHLTQYWYEVFGEPSYEELLEKVKRYEAN